MTQPAQELDQLASVSSLADPVRRRLYNYVAGNGGDVSRDEAAAAVGISRGLAAFHLDKLAAEGLLEVSFQRLTGRGGPGAGRPSKLYRRSQEQFDLSLPPRSYELAARLFAETLDDEGGPPKQLQGVAERFGRHLADKARELSEDPSTRANDLAPLQQVLSSYGFEPFLDDQGDLRLRNCPFHSLAQGHPALVCGMNLSIMQGLMRGLSEPDLEAVLEPRPGLCCVAFKKAADQS